MTTRTAHFVRAFVSGATLALLATFLPATSQAIQLRWSNGATDLTVSQNIRATLIVSADSSLVALPAEWRLLWTADSSGIQFVAPESLLACQTDTAKVSAIDPPATPADSAANLITAHFCDDGGAEAQLGYWTIELVGESRGKLKVVATDPADSFLIVESNEVTFNGGLDGEYSEPSVPVITSAGYSHEGSTLYIQATGTGLGSLTAARLSATDRTWTFPLTIIAQNDSSLSATAATVASVPACALEARAGDTGVTAWRLPEELVSLPTSPLFAPATMTDRDVDFYPKDFAFVYTPGKFHIIYIRHNAWERNHGGLPVPESVNEVEFGHQWTSNWIDWNGTYPRDTTVLKVTGTTWDNYHVWAPTVIQHGLSFYMYYTGVHFEAPNRSTQGICLARSTDLDNWTREATPVWTCDSVGTWADHAQVGSPYFGNVQFRDPFVMPDPSHSGKWLMYYTTILNGYYPNMVVGVATTTDTLGGRWRDVGPIVATDAFHTTDPLVESPHVFNSHGRWWLGMTSGAGHPLSLVQVYGNPVDTIPSDSTRWGLRYRLYQYLNDFAHDATSANTIANWIASEYLRVGDREFLGAYDGAGIQIAQLYWLGTSPDQFDLEYPTAGVDRPAEAASDEELSLRLLGMSPGHSSVRFEVHAPSGARSRVVIYDLQGRSVRTVFDGSIENGTQFLSWDGKSVDGNGVGSGVYFVRLITPAGARTARVALVR